MSFKLINERKGNEREFDNRADAEDQRDRLIELGMDSTDLKIVEAKSDGGAEVVDQEPMSDEELEAAQEAIEEGPSPTDLPDEKPSVGEDPVDWMPEHFVDEIQGVPTVNRKGYAVLASQYGVSVTAEPITLASKTDFEYAEFRAVAETEDGRRYSGFGSAHVDRGDDATLLNELAETRSLKRATAWATGLGITAIEEMKNTL